VVLPHPNDPTDPITSAFNNAVTVWRAQLAAYNIQLPNFVIDTDPNAPACSIPLDHGYCIQVNTSGISPCANTRLHAGPDGTFDEPAVITVNSDYTNWSSDVMNETFLHELGHMFDLDNHDDSPTGTGLCPNPGSVMNAPTHNQGCGDMTGRTATPQEVDVAAV